MSFINGILNGFCKFVRTKYRDDYQTTLSQTQESSTELTYQMNTPKFALNFLIQSEMN